MAKNKQIVISLHEGCLRPDHPIIREVESGTMNHPWLKNWLLRRLTNDPDCILIDKIEIIDCDCEVGS